MTPPLPSVNGKNFKASANSANGEVGSETLFHYHEDSRAVWAEYSGGRIARGFLIGKRVSPTTLDLRYQHVSLDGSIKTGICRSTLSLEADGRVMIREKWQWTCEDHSEGESTLIEA
jgi:hypothetical protein